MQSQSGQAWLRLELEQHVMRQSRQEVKGMWNGRASAWQWDTLLDPKRAATPMGSMLRVGDTGEKLDVCLDKP